jgi:hypothetical protein
MTVMPLDDYEEDLLIAVSLTQFAVTYERISPVVAEHARQLATDQLIEYDLEFSEARYELLL